MIYSRKRFHAFQSATSVIKQMPSKRVSDLGSYIGFQAYLTLPSMSGKIYERLASPAVLNSSVGRNFLLSDSKALDRNFNGFNFNLLGVFIFHISLSIHISQ